MLFFNPDPCLAVLASHFNSSSYPVAMKNDKSNTFESITLKDMILIPYAYS